MRADGVRKGQPSRGHLELLAVGTEESTFTKYLEWWRMELSGAAPSSPRREKVWALTY
jgi:hypothetical protein